MSLQFSEVYSLYADQINNLLKDRSLPWRTGFKNGLLASGPSQRTHRSHNSDTISEYDIAYVEGYHYATYKLSTNPEKLIAAPNIIVGFVVQDYNFSFKAITNGSLGQRYNSLTKVLHPVSLVSPPHRKDVSNEDSKILKMLTYLRGIHQFIK